MSNTVPEQCREICPVAKKDDLTEAPVVFAKNCSGPRIASRQDEKETYDLTSQSLVQPKLGEKICMNAGVYLSLKLEIEEEKLVDLK